MATASVQKNVDAVSGCVDRVHEYRDRCLDGKGIQKLDEKVPRDGCGLSVLARSPQVSRFSQKQSTEKRQCALR
jgi:hypothetical protein